MEPRGHDAEPLDDVDRLFLRIEPLAPPADFGARVAGLTTAGPSAARPRRWLWWAFDAVATAVLLALSISFGMALYEAGTVDVLALMLEVGAVGDALDALVETLPWGRLAALALNLAVVLVLSKLALGDDRSGTAAARPRAA
jgi:hypothetical protein